MIYFLINLSGRLLYYQHHTDARSFLFCKNTLDAVVMKYKTKSTDIEWEEVCILQLLYFKKRTPIGDCFLIIHF